MTIELNTTGQMLHKIADAIRTRGDALGWEPGRKRDEDKAFEAWVGAANALKLCLHPEAPHVIGYLNMILAVQGYDETVQLSDHYRAAVEGLTA